MCSRRVVEIVASTRTIRNTADPSSPIHCRRMPTTMTMLIVRNATATWWNFHHHAVRGAGDSAAMAATAGVSSARSAWSSSVPDA